MMFWYRVGTPLIDIPVKDSCRPKRLVCGGGAVTPHTSIPEKDAWYPWLLGNNIMLTGMNSELPQPKSSSPHTSYGMCCRAGWRIDMLRLYCRLGPREGATRNFSDESAIVGI